MSINNFKKLIFCAYAYGDMKSSANMSRCDDKMNTYLKNTVVALVSAKINNPNCDVALVTNIDIPSKFESIFKKFNVLIFKENFDEFVFDKDYKWGLAFYKLCALKKMLKKQYKSYLLLDTDTYTQSSLDDL